MHRGIGLGFRDCAVVGVMGLNDAAAGLLDLAGGDKGLAIDLLVQWMKSDEGRKYIQQLCDEINGNQGGKND